MMEIKNCGNCGSNNVRVKERRVHWATKSYRHVVCDNCGCTGKPYKIEYKAIDHWNEIMGKKEEEMKERKEKVEMMKEMEEMMNKKEEKITYDTVKDTVEMMEG